ncbi:MAG: hypothetical protein IKM98_13230 [Bacteroidales bacterium]|nr:hypothetical protein [Bacteroidales bacterium]
MKKISFSIAALAFAAMTLASSCVIDKDKEDEEIKSDTDFLYISGSRVASKDGTLPANSSWKISPNVVAKSSKTVDDDAEATGFKGKISEIFKDATYRTTIYGFNDSEFMSITYNGKDSKEYSYTQQIDGSVSQLLFEYMETGSLTEAMKGKFDIEALIIYKSAKNADAESGTVWISSECTINPSSLQVKGVSYIQGTFTARMQNKAGDTFILSPGAYSCLGW